MSRQQCATWGATWRGRGHTLRSLPWRLASPSLRRSHNFIFSAKPDSSWTAHCSPRHAPKMAAPTVANPVFVEVLPGLRRVSICVGADSQGRHPVVQVEGPQVVCAWPGGGKTAGVSLGCRLDAKSATRIVRGKFTFISVPLAKGYRIDPPLELPFSSELDVKRIQALYCRACGHRLTPSSRGPPAAILPLPSPHWMDLSALWYCHEESVPSKLLQLAKTPAKAQAGRWLVGRIHILMHTIDVDSAAVRAHAPKRLDGDTQAWAPLTCSGCGVLLGAKRLRFGENVKDDSVRLEKCRLAAEPVAEVASKSSKPAALTPSRPMSVDLAATGLTSGGTSLPTLGLPVPGGASRSVGGGLGFSRRNAAGADAGRPLAPLGGPGRDRCCPGDECARARTRYKRVRKPTFTGTSGGVAVTPQGSSSSSMGGSKQGMSFEIVSSSSALPLATIHAMERLGLGGSGGGVCGGEKRAPPPKSGATVDVFAPYTVASVFAEELVSACEAHNCFRFLLHDPRRTTVIAVTLLSTNTRVAIARPATDTQATPAVKLWFSRLASGDADAVRDWVSTNKAEVWVEPSAQCKAILAALERGAHPGMPHDKAGNRVSYLRRVASG